MQTCWWLWHVYFVMSSLPWGKAGVIKLFFFKRRCLKCLSLPGYSTKQLTAPRQLEKTFLFWLFLLEIKQSAGNAKWFTDIFGGCLGQDEWCLFFRVVFSELSWQLKIPILNILNASKNAVLPLQRFQCFMTKTVLRYTCKRKTN